MTDAGAVRFAEKILALLDRGQFAATYKYAVLLAFLDLTLENVDRTGGPPEVLTTRQLAAKVIEIYWPQTIPYAAAGGPEVLRQNATAKQAAIVREIADFRADVAAKHPVGSIVQLRQRDRSRYERLCNVIEWHLIEMPLPRLQIVGNLDDRFLYQINWDRTIRRAEITAYQQGHRGDFDNRILLRPGVGRHLMQFSPLLRPLIQKHWAAMVASVNRLEESRLERFLFGASRGLLAKACGPLSELQRGRCFYCEDGLRETRHVDHFIPWSRYPTDVFANLVVAHDRCNLDKRDFLAATPHVVRWAQRLDDDALEQIARDLRWDAAAAEMRGVARGIYLSLPDDAILWRRGAEFEHAASAQLREALG